MEVVWLAEAGPRPDTMVGLGTGMAAVSCYTLFRLLGKISGTNERDILARNRTYPVVPAVSSCDACHEDTHPAMLKRKANMGDDEGETAGTLIPDVPTLLN